MVTGIETVGVVVAILPLVVNQLDAYVQGIETIRGLGTRRYRRQLEEYSTRLGTQHAILLNTLEESLDGLVDYEDEITELINHPRGPLWKDTSFQAKLRKKLDRNYDAFTRTMAELSILLETLSRRLGLETADSMKIRWDDATVVEREIKKFKDVFSKSVYTDLFNKIENANAALKMLIEQSRYREESRRKRQISRRPLAKYRTVRKHALVLYNAVIRGEYWKCPCKDSHCVHLRIEPQPFETNDDHESITTVPKLRMAFTSRTTRQSSASSWYWQEVETIPVPIDTPVEAAKKPSTQIAASRVASGRKVRFGIVTSTLNSLPWPKVENLPPALPISDLCSVLCTVKAKSCAQEYIGSILDESDSTHRYNFYSTENLDHDMEMASLEDLLTLSSRPPGLHAAHGAFIFSRHDRLILAATLASSVLQFHDSWLKSQWSSRDILFAKWKDGGESLVNHPYLSGHEVSKPEGSDLTTTTTNLIRNEVLFPLGLALVELSLCQSISALRTTQDNDAVEAVANLKIASRVLDRVYSESGCRYGDVVDQCLWWPATRSTKMDDDDFQQLVFQRVVSPLFEDLKDFEGKSRIR